MITFTIFFALIGWIIYLMFQIVIVIFQIIFGFFAWLVGHDFND